MPLIRSVFAAALIVAALAQPRAAAQDAAAQDHAKKVLESLRQSKFDDVTAEFDAQMTAAVSRQQLEQLWTTIKGEMGEFKSVVDQRAMDVQGMKVVVSGCQFDTAVLDIMVAFDGASKIAGLQVRARPAPAPAAAPAPSPAPQAPPARD